MGIFDKLFKRGPKNVKPAPSFDGWMPIFSQFGNNIYASDVVQQALKCIVDEFKKLNPTHIRYASKDKTGSDPVPVRGNIQDVLDDPNPLMTTSEMLEKACWLLLMNYNVFILPVYKTWQDAATGQEVRYFESLYPINPTQVDFIEDATDTLFVKFWFFDGSTSTVKYSDVIHVKYNYSVNDYMGGNMMGQPDHGPLLETLELNRKLLQGIAKAMNASYAVNGIVKYNTMLDDGHTEAALRELERKLKNSEDGFLPLDMKADFTPFSRAASLVDKPTLEFIDSKILRNWGVPLAILTGDYSAQQYEAFYQKVIEPLALAFSQAFTKKLFTRREALGFGNKIAFYPKDLIFLSMDQTLRAIYLLAPTGAIFENEKRTALGMRPLPELEGKRFMSLNWINADDASQYQIGKVNVDVVDESKTVTEE